MKELREEIVGIRHIGGDRLVVLDRGMVNTVIPCPIIPTLPSRQSLSIPVPSRTLFGQPYNNL